jgi:hypothetical protein
MIQRIQTVYLLLSLVACILLFIIPEWQSSSMDITMGEMEMIGGGTHLFLIPVAALLVISHLVAIFSYKHRKRQKQFCTGNILLFIIFLLLTLLVIQLEHSLFQSFNIMEFRTGILLPFAGIILNILAQRGIKKDEALIRSMDRLR